MQSIHINGRDVGLDELVGPEIAALILGLSPRTVRDWGIQGKLPVYKVGSRRNRFLVQDLLDWCEGRRREAKP